MIKILLKKALPFVYLSLIVGSLTFLVISDFSKDDALGATAYTGSLSIVGASSSSGGNGTNGGGGGQGGRNSICDCVGCGRRQNYGYGGTYMTQRPGMPGWRSQTTGNAKYANSSRNSNDVGSLANTNTTEDINDWLVRSATGFPMNGYTGTGAYLESNPGGWHFNFGGVGGNPGDPSITLVRKEEGKCTTAYNGPTGGAGGNSVNQIRTSIGWNGWQQIYSYSPGSTRYYDSDTYTSTRYELATGIRNNGYNTLPAGKRGDNGGSIGGLGDRVGRVGGGGGGGAAGVSGVPGTFQPDVIKSQTETYFHTMVVQGGAGGTGGNGGAEGFGGSGGLPQTQHAGACGKEDSGPGAGGGGGGGAGGSGGVSSLGQNVYVDFNNPVEVRNISNSIPTLRVQSGATGASQGDQTSGGKGGDGGAGGSHYRGNGWGVAEGRDGQDGQPGVGATGSLGGDASLNFKSTLIVGKMQSGSTAAISINNFLINVKQVGDSYSSLYIENLEVTNSSKVTISADCAKSDHCNIVIKKLTLTNGGAFDFTNTNTPAKLIIGERSNTINAKTAVSLDKESESNFMPKGQMSNIRICKSTIAFYGIREIQHPLTGEIIKVISPNAYNYRCPNDDISEAQDFADFLRDATSIVTPTLTLETPKRDTVVDPIEMKSGDMTSVVDSDLLNAVRLKFSRKMVGAKVAKTITLVGYPKTQPNKKTEFKLDVGASGVTAILSNTPSTVPSTYNGAPFVKSTSVFFPLASFK